MPGRGVVDQVIRETFGEFEVQPENQIWHIVREVGMKIADREIADRMMAIEGFVRVAKELIEALELGPFDEVVSVAIKGTDGTIRVVQIGRG